MKIKSLSQIEKVSEKFFINTQNTKSLWEEVNAQPVIIPKFEFIDAFIIREENIDEDEDLSYNRISECKSGALIYVGYGSVNSLMIFFSMFLSEGEYNEENFNDLVLEVINEHGLSPRYSSIKDAK